VLATAPGSGASVKWMVSVNHPPHLAAEPRRLLNNPG
jgi:hypothetical protein